MNGSESLARFERSLTRVMLAGVWMSAALLTLGLTVLLIYGPSGAGDMLLRAGLITLMGTPVLRVLLSVTEALRQRDWFWIWNTAAVVLVLAGTIAYSLRTAA